MLKHPRTPSTNNNLAMDYQTADSEHMLKRSRPFGISDEVLDTQFKLLLFIVKDLAFWKCYLHATINNSKFSGILDFRNFGVLFN